MTDIEYIREKLEASESSLERCIDSVRRGNITDADRGATQAFSAASYSLVLDEPAKARTLFGEGASLRALEAYDQILREDIIRLPNTENGVFAGILSGTPRARTTMARVALNNVNANTDQTTWDDYWRTRIGISASIALGNDDDAVQHLDNFHRFEEHITTDDVPGEFDSIIGAFISLYRGVIDADPDRLERGATAAAEISWQDRDSLLHRYVCQEALAGIELGRARGTNAHVDHPLVPDPFYANAWRTSPADELSETAAMILDAIEGHDPTADESFSLTDGL